MRKIAFSWRRRRMMSRVPGGLAVMFFCPRLPVERPDRKKTDENRRGEMVRRIQAAWRRYGYEFGPSAREGE